MFANLAGAEWVRDTDRVTARAMARAAAGQVDRGWVREADRRAPHDQTSKATARSNQPARSDDVFRSRGFSFISAADVCETFRPRQRS